MQTARIAIVGGGLSGIYAAFLLEQMGIRDYVLFEARERLGGRIACASPQATAAGDINRFDLGPGWFWPDFQPQLDQLIRELDLARFPQFDTGDMLVEHATNAPPTRIVNYTNVPTSMRLVGGMQSLVDALYQRLDKTRILIGHTVQQLRASGTHVELDNLDSHGHSMNWRVEHILLATPPRLAAATITFTPALPQALARQWRGTATWMAPHAKYLAFYETPFWRERGLSGEARSAAGPLGEIHDAAMPGGYAALLGFVGLPARVRKNIPEGTLRQYCREQFVRLFGPEAATPIRDVLQDWATEPYTTTDDDLEGILEHPFAPAAAAASGSWANRLTGIAAEWSPQFTGYVAGAIEAAGLGTRALLGTQKSDTREPA